MGWIAAVGETAGERRRRMRTASMFLEELFEPVAVDSSRAHAERVCVFCRSRNPEDIGKPGRDVQMQMFPRVAELAGTPVGRSVEGWRRSRTDYLERVFEHVNARGWDVFVGVNTFRPLDRAGGGDALGRTRDHLGSVLRVQLDLDGSLAENAGALELMRQDAIDGLVPAPTFVLRSSPEKYQALWSVDGDEWTAGQAELYSHLLAVRYGGDEVVTPATQVMRVPGFRNAKAEYRGQDGSPVVEQVELSSKLWPLRRAAGCTVESFRPLEGVVPIPELRKGLEKWVKADQALGVSWSQVDEAARLSAEMARENEGWRLRLRTAAAAAGVVLPARMRGTVPEVPHARFSNGWPGRAVDLPRGAVEAAAPSVSRPLRVRKAGPDGAAPLGPASADRGSAAVAGADRAAPAASGGRWVNRRGVPTFVPERESRAARLRRVGVAEGWIREGAGSGPVSKDGRKPSEYDKQDWGRVLQALENGQVPAEIVKALARVRSAGDGAKSDPFGYARKTVGRALKRLEEKAAERGEVVAEPVTCEPVGEVSGPAWQDAALLRAGRPADVPVDPEVSPSRAGSTRAADAPSRPAQTFGR